MTLYGRNTKLLDEKLTVTRAAAEYPRWYAVVVDPERSNGKVVAGGVAAVSKTHDGAFRALMAMGPITHKVTVAKLA